MKKVRWGIVSTARIGTKAVIPAMQAGKYSKVAAIASRRLEAAQDVANQFGIPDVYGSYDALFASADIDAVYIPVPNHMHVPLAIQALEAGKHVLVEKPLALSSTEAQELVEMAASCPNLKIMEAFMYRFHPQWLKAVELVRSGAIGTLKTIHSFFSYTNLDAANVRNTAAYGGGGLMDIGCYSISLSRLLFGKEPNRVMGTQQFDPDFNVDSLTSGIMDFGEGTSTFTCSTQVAPHQQVQVFGSTGKIEVKIPFNPVAGEPAEIELHNDDGPQILRLEGSNQYTLQGDAISKAILEGHDVPTPLSDGVANMRVLEAIVRSGETGAWASV